MYQKGRFGLVVYNLKRVCTSLFNSFLGIAADVAFLQITDVATTAAVAFAVPYEVVHEDLLDEPCPAFAGVDHIHHRHHLEVPIDPWLHLELVQVAFHHIEVYKLK